MNKKLISCVFVHGWAMNSAVWDECLKKLPDWLDIITVDLPGHGSMAGVPAENIDDYVQALYPLVHRPAIWVGWSLGGLAVLRLAELYPQKVAAAMLVACSPCFVQKNDWSCGVDKQVFQKFSYDLKADQEKTLRRFLALQVKGTPAAMTIVRQLQNSLRERGAASLPALQTGLDILLNEDLRSSLSTIDSDLYWYLGGRDSLVPAETADRLQQDLAQSNVSLQLQAGHAPFLSHTEDFCQQLLHIAERCRDS